MATTPLTQLKGVGDALAAKFKKLGVTTVEELVEYVPFRFDDYSQVIRVSQIRPGPVTIKVTFSAVKSRYSKRGLHLTEATASDESGSVKVVWFNQPYRAKALKPDEEYFVSGEFAQNYKFMAIANPACELVSQFPVNTARLVPVYRLTKGLGATQVRKTMKSALQSRDIPETLPAWLIEDEHLMSRADALYQVHFPDSIENLSHAKHRLGFEEVFQLSLASELNKQAFAREHSQQIPFNEAVVKEFVANLPFKLTADQRKVAWQIYQDMQQGAPMNRLVEGDVGSGKTVVAAMAAIGAISAGFQVAFMAPTELLANQHFSSLKQLLGDDTSVELLSGSVSVKERKEVLSKLKSGATKLVVGTHALFQDAVEMQRLGLVIVDEQHRFGVEQRKKLQSKADMMPHTLHLTATPTPRSLALTLYGEMDVSIIHSLPEGRKPIDTHVEKPENRQKIYHAVAESVKQGRQAFVVCPQITTEEASRLSVEHVHAELQKKWLKDCRLGLLHGRLPSEEKEVIMQSFVNGDIDVLVSTTVIEVGVDVPNATMMIIEAADSFGLAQLHQLRGRVGRGEHASTCILVTTDNDTSSQRLRYLETERDGFKLAEYDMELRGPGAIYGTMQHGALDLRIAKITDTKLIASARNAAQAFVSREENLLQYSQLAARVAELRTVTNLN